GPAVGVAGALAGLVVAVDEGEHVGAGGLTGRDALQEDVHQVVPDIGVGAGVDTELALVVGRERAARPGGRCARAGGDGALNVSLTGGAEHVVVVDTVTADEQALVASRTQLLEERARLSGVPAVVDGAGAGLDDLGHDAVEL